MTSLDRRRARRGPAGAHPFGLTAATRSVRGVRSQGRLEKMTKNLVIVESPAKARTIERYLGPGYSVLASYGHVRDLPENPGKDKLGVDVEHDFAPEYVVSEDRKQAGRRDRQGGHDGRHGLPRHRPRPRGRGDRLARRRGGQRPPGQDAPGDLLRDHRRRDPRGVRQPARDRPQPRRRAAGAAHPRPPRRLHAQPAAVAQGARRPVRRPRPVGRRAPRRRARARDPRLHARASTGRIEASSRPTAASASRPSWCDRRRDAQEGRGRGPPDRRRRDGRATTPRRCATLRRGRRHQSAAQSRAQPGAAVHDSTLQQEASRKLGFNPKRTMRVAQHLYEGAGDERGPRRPHHLHAHRLDRRWPAWR